MSFFIYLCKSLLISYLKKKKTWKKTIFCFWNTENRQEKETIYQNTVLPSVGMCKQKPLLVTINMHKRFRLPPHTFTTLFIAEYGYVCLLSMHIYDIFPLTMYQRKHVNWPINICMLPTICCCLWSIFCLFLHP